VTVVGNPAITPTSMSGGRAAVSVDELKRAWVAVQEGQFRRRPTAGPHAPGTARLVTDLASSDLASRTTIEESGHVWTPEPFEQVLPVVGCAGSAGTTTVAFAVALTAGISARLVECSSMTASGLAAASNAELGLHKSGWRQGERDQVLLERASEVLVRVDEVPMPTPGSSTGSAPADATLTVLDIGWELGHLLATPCWLNETVRKAHTVIAVAPATVPGLRRLEGALELLGADRTIAAVLGPRFKKWPKGVAHSAGLNTRRLLELERFVEIGRDPALAVTGLDSAALPAQLLQAAGQLLARTHITAARKASPHQKGTRP
jgi:hypothetical protein